MKCFVTGGAGFIGSHLIDRLVENGHEVIGIDDYSGGHLRNVRDDIDFYYADCRDEKEMWDLFKEHKPEMVFHLAANPAENKAQFSPIDVTSRGYDAFIKVLAPAIKNGLKRFVFTSSIAVYGALTPPFTEDMKPEPEDLYGIGKLACEQSIEVLSKVHGFEYNILRPHNVYGPRQSMIDPYRNVVMIWMNKILKDEPYEIFGSGGNARCYTYVDDVIDGIYEAGFSSIHNEVFNLGADVPYTLEELSDAILRVTESTTKPIKLDARPQEVVVSVSDHKKIKEMLGIEAKTDLMMGLTKTWEYAKSRGPQDFIYTKIEIPSEKMPKNWREHV